MAASIKAYGKAGTHFAAGEIDWVADTVKMSLHTSAYAVSQGADDVWGDVTHEIAAGGGYSAGGFALAGKTRSYDASTREERFDADDLNPGALTPASPYRYGVIRAVTSGILICYLNFGADQDPGGLPFAVQWNDLGIFYIQAS